MFNNFKNRIHTATYSLKEKMGRTNATIETEDTRAMKQNFKTIKHGYQNINHAGKSYLTESEKIGLITNELGDSLLLLGSGSFSTTPLGLGLQTFGNQLKSISSVSQNYVAATNTNFVSPISKMLDNEIKRANDIYKRQEQARIKYDLALEAVRKQGGSGRAAEELEICRQTYEQLTFEFTEVSNTVLAQIGNELIYELKNWTDSQARYYTEMSKMWSQVTSQLEGIPSGSSQMSTTSSVVNAYVPLTPTTESYISNAQTSYQPTTSSAYSYQPSQTNYQTTAVNTASYSSNVTPQTGYQQQQQQTSFPSAATPNLVTVPETITSTTTPINPYNQQGSISLNKNFPQRANQESADSPFALNEPTTLSKPKASNPFD